MAMPKVLIIDDEKNVRESLSSILSDEGFQVLKAVDGTEGLSVFEKEKPEVIFLDIWMPGMDGLEALKLIREKDKDAKVIVMSGHGTISTAVEAVKLGAYDFLEKPLSIDKVLEVILRSLAGEYKPESPSNDVGLKISKGQNIRAQKTIGKSIVVYGTGLFSGVKTGMILLPMPENSGIVFEHIPDGERIHGYIDYVYSVGFSSSVKGKTCIIKTIEHLLATLHMYGITNLLVKVSEEIPIFDGSAIEICKKIEEAGVLEQREGLDPVAIREKIVLPNLSNSQYLSIEPSDVFEIDYTLEQGKPIGTQRYHFTGDTADFVRDIAPARTFGFIKDFGRLAKIGQGGRIDNVMANVIILSDDGVVNTKLRFEDEFVRHKILDVIGDTYLLNRPIIGKISAKQTGHLENIALMRELKKLFYQEQK
ncbi:MAG: UDP-3-O-acyl-N-acetylglucosamine deacetylase [Syntrophobacterales bacterium]|jgi:UDP-3-O-[3-hydroxymyristoyl] N-acetylglucosamine deacetylase|nr:UDP-3-O-acyl-N-acetylglucosamine deacetylase [Syntrophobacterales bacterium]